MESIVEEWRDIEGYEGLYKISSLGKIKSLERKIACKNCTERIIKEKIIKQSHGIKNKTYLRASLSKNGSKKTYLVHRLVADAFILNPESKLEINHKDCNKLNNNINNLEWCTHKENVNHAWESGLMEKTRTLGLKNLNDFSQKIRKPVLQYDLNGKLIKEHLSQVQAEKSLGKGNTGNVGRCCRGELKIVYGFIWRFKQ